MKVEWSNLKTPTYEEVKVGEVFESFGEVYMKVNGDFGSVNLGTGFLHVFHDNEVVTLVDASLHAGYA